MPRNSLRISRAAKKVANAALSALGAFMATVVMTEDSYLYAGDLPRALTEAQKRAGAEFRSQVADLTDARLEAFGEPARAIESINALPEFRHWPFLTP